MPRIKRMRRFDAHHVVSALTIQAEVEALRREITDYAILAPSDLDAMRSDRKNLATQTWEHLVLLFGGLSEQDRRVLQALVFRDLYFVVELYRTHLRGNAVTSDASPPTGSTQPQLGTAFDEWLFNIER